MAMGAGKLDTRCAFQKLTKVSDGGGGFKTTWATQFSRWGGFALPNLRSNMDAISAGSITSEVLADLIIREDSGTQTITPEWRLTAKGWTWNVRKVAPPMRTGYLRLILAQGVPDSGMEVAAGDADSAVWASGDNWVWANGDNATWSA